MEFSPWAYMDQKSQEKDSKGINSTEIQVCKKQNFIFIELNFYVKY